SRPPVAGVVRAGRPSLYSSSAASLTPQGDFVTHLPHRLTTLAMRIPAFALVVVTACTPKTAPTPVVAATATTGERAIRRDIPLTNTIRRAYAAGTRDSTGRPGRNYWQQWMEYTINARLDVPTSRITGHESITLHNNSDSTL